MEPLKLINALRETDFYIEAIFMQGSCYRFYLFLKSIFPQAKPFISDDKDHIVTLIEGELYDINGIIKTGHYSLLKEKDLPMVEKWSFRGKMLLQLDECPNCEEPLIFNQ